MDVLHPMHDRGLVYAFLMNRQGGGRRLDWDGVRAWNPSQGLLWMHLDRNFPDTPAWLARESGLDPLVAEALQAEETRPRFTPYDEGGLVMLRGINPTPGAEADDMVSVRVWLDEHRIITVRLRKLLGVVDLRERIEAGVGPCSTGDFITMLTELVYDRMQPVLHNLKELTDQAEEQVVEDPPESLRQEIAVLRRRVIVLRRYIAPQRDVLRELEAAPYPWLSDDNRDHLRELQDQVTRYVEDLDALRDREQVIHQEFGHHMTERINRAMYALTLATTVFLPLTFITGLFGINMAGIPGADNPAAFYFFTAALAFLALMMMIAFRKRKWM